MGDILSGILGTDSQVDVQNQNPYAALQPWQVPAQGLAMKLQSQSDGNGPNPAQSQYLQNSQQIAQQQANMYSQNRALNPGLAARMAGNTAANVQQNAAAQAGTQQAQQQLASQQLLSNLTYQQQEALNKAGAVNAGLAGGNQQARSGIVGGIMQGAGMAFMPGGGQGMAYGGSVRGYDAGGEVNGDNKSTLSNFLSGAGLGAYDPQNQQSGAFQAGKGIGFGVGKGIKGLLGSPSGQQVSMLNVAPTGAMMASRGGKIGGSAQMSGDHPSNDTVPAMLSPGEIVIPRSVTQSDNAPDKSAQFVAAVLSRHRIGKKK